MAKYPTMPTLPDAPVGEAHPATPAGADRFADNEAMRELRADAAKLTEMTQNPADIEAMLKGSSDESPYVPSDQDQLFKPIATTGETVTVACKVPCGLLIQLCQFTTVSEAVMGGGVREVQQAQRVGERVKLNGFANPVNGTPKNITYGGYGMTYGVPKEFFDEWLRQNADSDLVRNGLVFAIRRASDAQTEARAQHKNRSGFEPLDPEAKLKVGLFQIEEATRENVT